MISLLNNIKTTFPKRDTRDVIIRRDFISPSFIEVWRHEYYVYRKFNLFNLKAIFFALPMDTLCINKIFIQ